MNRIETIDDLRAQLYPRARVCFDHPDGLVGFRRPYQYVWYSYGRHGYELCGSTRTRGGATKHLFQGVCGEMLA